jgi:3',5'-cyclic AMP phosphodiesterase CpdA
VVLRDLAPGAVYRYRVVSRDILKFAPYKVDFGETVNTAFQEFRTPDTRKQVYSFLVFNDVHDIPATLPEMLKAAGDAPYDFVAMNGDIVDDIDREEQIIAMLSQAVASFASRIPMIWVRGNHETRGKLARDFPRYVDSPNGHYYYSFDHGPVHFIVLDTGEDKFDGSPEYSGLVDFYAYRRQQGEWLKAEVKSDAFRRAKFRVVFAHMPFPAGRRRPQGATASAQPDPFTGMADAFDNFGSTLEQAGIDMMISGHTHNAAIIEPEPGRHSYPIIQGGGPKGPGRTIMRISVDDRGLEATVLRPDGTTFGTRSVAAKR